MQNYSAPSTPISLNKSTEAQIYGLFAMALALTCVGILIGLQFAVVLMNTGIHLFFLDSQSRHTSFRSLQGMPMEEPYL